MKKGAALSLVLAPAGTAMFWVTHAVWARASGMSDAADINVPARTTKALFIVFSRNRRVFSARLHRKYVERPTDGQFGWDFQQGQSPIWSIGLKWSPSTTLTKITADLLSPFSVHCTGLA